MARARSPEKYGSVDPDMLDQEVADRLADDERRPKWLAKVRENLRFRPEVSAQQLYDALAKSVAHKFRVAPQATSVRAPMSAEERAAEQRYGSDMKQAAGLEQQRIKSEWITKDTLDTGELAARREQAMTHVPPLEAVEQPDKGRAAPGMRAPLVTYPQQEDWRDFMRVARNLQPDIDEPEKPAQRYKIRMLDSTPSLIDTHNADSIVTTSNPLVSFAQDKVPGANILSRFWEGSDLLQGATSAARWLHDPSVGSSKGVPTGIIRTGYGPQEYEHDLAEELARKSPAAARAGGTAAKWLTYAGTGFGQVGAAIENESRDNQVAALQQAQAEGRDPEDAIRSVLGMSGPAAVNPLEGAQRAVGDSLLVDALETANAAKTSTKYTPGIQAQVYRQAMDA